MRCSGLPELGRSGSRSAMGVTRRARDMDEFRGAVAPPEDTPYSRHFARLDATMEQQKGIGRILVRGIERPEDAEEMSDDEDEDYSSLTEEQMNCLRHIIVTQRRADELDS